MAGPPGKPLSPVCFEFKRDIKEVGQPIHWRLWRQGWVHADTLGSYSDSHSPCCLLLMLTLSHMLSWDAWWTLECRFGYSFEALVILIAAALSPWLWISPGTECFIDASQMLEFGSVDTAFDFVSYSTCAVCFPLNICHTWGCYLLKVIIKVIYQKFIQNSLIPSLC